MSITERLALIISARADQALREIQKVRVEATGLKGSVGAASQATSAMGANLKASGGR